MTEMRGDRGRPIRARPDSPRRRSYSTRALRSLDQQRAGDRHVVADRRLQLGNRQRLVGGVRGMDRSGAEQQRLAPARRGTECRSCRETPPRRTRQRSAAGPAALRGRARSPPAARAARWRGRISRGVAHRPKHHLGLRRRRDDVGRDAADDQPDRVVRAARAPDRTAARCARSATSASISLSIADSPSSGKRRVRGAAGRAQLAREACRASRAPSRLSVGSPSTRNARSVRRRRSRACAPSLPRSSPTTNSRPTRVSPVAPQPLGRRDLRGENALRRRTRRGRTTRPPSTRLGKNGGTQSKCVEKTTAGRRRRVAMTLNRPSSTGCSVTV